MCNPPIFRFSKFFAFTLLSLFFLASGTALKAQDYCIPASDPDSQGYGEYINSFSTTGLTQISNENTGWSANGYGDFSATHSAVIRAGQTLSFSAAPQAPSTPFTFKIWVDYDGDKTFEASELVYSGPNIVGTRTGMFTIPGNTPAANIRMRIMLDHGTGTNPCPTFLFGETEDYTLTVIPANTCWAGDVSLNTQTQVDDFVAGYAGCNHIMVNNLIIGYASGLDESNITDITPLQNIRTVMGNLTLRKNPQLTSLNGLHNVTTTYGYLYIRNNGQMTHIDALQGLTTIGTYIEVFQNPMLQNLNGLQNITAINGAITLNANPALTDIQGLANIAHTTMTGLTITANPELSVCNLSNFCTYLSNPDNPRDIYGNKDNCLDEQAVTNACASLNTTNILYVDMTASGWATGSSWANAYTSLADALIEANGNAQIDSILVARGTYYPEYIPPTNDPTTDRDKIFYFLRSGLAVLGGYPSGGGTRDWQANPTLLSGDIGTPNDPADNAHHVILALGTGSAPIDHTLHISGFTVEGGNANGSGNFMVGTASIDRGSAGGMFNFAASPTLTHTTISGNSAASYGGGMINVFGSSPTLSHVTVSGNNAAQGGGMYNASVSLTLHNTMISGNNATYGGGIYDLSSSTALTNVTISGNAATDGGAIFTTAFSNLTIHNSIILGNSSGILNLGNSIVPIIKHSLVQDMAGGDDGNLNGNSITATQVFVSPVTGDYSLIVGENPVINAGLNSLYANLDNTTLDLAGNLRVYSGTTTGIIDMGAYEADCNGYNLALNASATKPLGTGDNYVYHSCSLLAIVNPENASGDMTVATTTDAGLISRGNARYLRRYYQLTADNPGNTDVTLFFTKAEFDHYNQTFGNANDAVLPANLRIGRYADGYSVSGSVLTSATDPIYIEPSSISWNASLGLWEVTFATPGFSGFFITGQSNALPVTLTDFSAALEEKSVGLTWQTTSEVDFSHFEPERSGEGKQWHKLAAVTAAGGSEMGAVYRYRDESPLGGINYYRLKMVDRDGTYAYSDIRSILTKASNDKFLLVYPSPATDRVYLETGAEIDEVLLWDISGRLMKRGRYDKRAGISLIGMGSGVILAEVRLQNGTTQMSRVVVSP